MFKIKYNPMSSIIKTVLLLVLCLAFASSDKLKLSQGVRVSL